MAVSLSVGWALGARFSNSSRKPKPIAEKLQPPEASAPPGEETESESEDEDDVADGDLSNVKAQMFEQCKLVRRYRTQRYLWPPHSELGPCRSHGLEDDVRKDCSSVSKVSFISPRSY